MIIPEEKKVEMLMDYAIQLDTINFQFDIVIGGLLLLFVMVLGAAALIVIQWKNQAIVLKDIEYLKAKVKKMEEADIQDVETTELSKSDTLLT